MSRQVDRPDLASRPFDEDRDGFVMGEGAGFVVLQRAADARSEERHIAGYVLGHASTADAFNLVAPCPDGRGALVCMRRALEDAGLTFDDLSHVNAHGTSTVPGDASEAMALSSLADGARLPITAVKGTTGHLIAGSGAVEAIVALRSLQAASFRRRQDFARSIPRSISTSCVTSRVRSGRARPCRTRSASAE